MNSQAARKSIDSEELMKEDLMDCWDQSNDRGDQGSSPGTSGVVMCLLENTRTPTSGILF